MQHFLFIAVHYVKLCASVYGSVVRDIIRLFLFGYPQRPEPAHRLLALAEWHKLTYLVKYQ